MNSKISLIKKEWQKLKALQLPKYKDEEELEFELRALEEKPNIVNFEEINELREVLAKVEDNQLSILQIGDCCESFGEATENDVRRRALFYELAGQLVANLTGNDTIVIGRIAGQYGKPRSCPYEKVNGQEYLAFKGEIVNGLDLTQRDPDPKRLVTGYELSKSTKDKIDSFIKNKAEMTQELLQSNEFCIKDEELAEQLNSLSKESTYETKLFVSHEALLIFYEQCFLRESNGLVYNCSTHFPWVGARTNQLDNAHINFVKHIYNPVGIKVSHKMNISELIKSVKLVNPANEKGKVALILRIGYNNLDDYVTDLAREIKSNSGLLKRFKLHFLV